MDKATEIELYLNDNGYMVKLETKFYYGQYGYYFNFKDSKGYRKQINTRLGSKKECYYYLLEGFYKAITQEYYYKYNQGGK